MFWELLVGCSLCAALAPALAPCALPHSHFDARTRGSFGCCGAAAAVFQFESRRTEAQRYARIGEATDDFEEEDFVDVEAEDGGEEDDDDDDLPQLSPPPAQPAPPAQAARTPQAATPVTPAAPHEYSCLRAPKP